MSSAILRVPAVCERTSLSRSTLYRLIQAGEFPRPIELSPGRVGFPVETVDSWLDERVERAPIGGAR